MERIKVSADVEVIASAAVDAAFCVHTELGPGLLESAYEDCFVHELRLRGMSFARQVPVPVNYKGAVIGTAFRADIVVEGKLLLEIKAVEQLLGIHKAQVITYLKLLKLPLGLVINFNESLIRDGLMRVLNVPKAKSRLSDRNFIPDIKL
jgi:GxxExxY protein